MNSGHKKAPSLRESQLNAAAAVRPQLRSPNTVQPKAVTNLGPKKPVAPNVYRPQPVPLVLQRKVASQAQSRGVVSAQQPQRSPIANGKSKPATIQTKTHGRSVIQRSQQHKGGPPPPQQNPYWQPEATPPPQQPQYGPYGMPYQNPTPMVPLSPYGFPLPPLPPFGLFPMPPPMWGPHVAPAPLAGQPPPPRPQVQQPPPPPPQDAQPPPPPAKAVQPPPPPGLPQPADVGPEEAGPLSIESLRIAIGAALGEEQPSQHIAPSKAGAETRRDRVSKLKGIHTVLDSRHKRHVAGEIFDKLKSNKKLKGLAKEGEGVYDRSQHLCVKLGSKYDGWEARAEEFGWGEMHSCDIILCVVTEIRIQIRGGQWHAKFHFVPYSHIPKWC